MDAVHFELAAEYLVMSAMLAEIKSRMLLPRQESVLDEELDPRASLIRRLQEYEQFKQAAEDSTGAAAPGHVFQAAAQPPELRRSWPQPQVELRELLLAFGELSRRAAMNVSHHVQMERLSTRGAWSKFSRARPPPSSAVPHREGRMGDGDLPCHHGADQGR
jgi:segregation and condensation protein A